MGLFFNVRTAADRKLLQDYDAAVETFRAEVSRAMDEAAEKAPSLAKALHTAAEALRARPLPSEANDDPAALRRLALSSLTVETVFSKLQALAASDEDFAAAMTVPARMREIGKETTAKPEFRPLTQAVLRAVAELKPEVARDMEDRVFDAYLAALKGPSPAAKRGPAPGAP
jgi:hypothetical protein